MNSTSHNNTTPLHFAAQFEHLDVIEFLLDIGASHTIMTRDKCTPLDVVNGTHVVRGFVKRLASKVGKSITEEEVVHVSDQILELRRTKVSPLAAAAKHNVIEVIDWVVLFGGFIDAKDNGNDKQDNELENTKEEGTVIEEKADDNISEDDNCDEFGTLRVAPIVDRWYHPLSEAVKAGNSECAKLLQKGANPTPKST